MAYNYQSPTGDVQGFLVFAFAGGIATLLIVTSSDFWSEIKAGCLLFASLSLVLYLCPAAIYTKVAYRPGSWSAPNTFCFAMAIVAWSLFGLTFSLYLIKQWHPHIREFSLDTNPMLKDDNSNNPDSPPESKMKALRTELEQHMWHWGLCLLYFFMRYPFAQVFYPLVSCVVNLVFVVLYHPPQVACDDIIFFSTFLSTLSCLAIWLSKKKALITGLFHFLITLNAVIICYFISDSAFLVKMLLGSLIVYFSTLWRLMRAPEPDNVTVEYHTIAFLASQFHLFWLVAVDMKSFSHDMEDIQKAWWIPRSSCCGFRGDPRADWFNAPHTTHMPATHV